ncbi:MAG: hypothetical protein ISS91_02295 [Candidatus Omnitrophica bacterium]|nr:hypothetical protein [Candidatus Omnitrophota bacterium]
MNFEFSRYNLKERDAFLQRLFEILPGLVSWSVILGMLALSFLKPIIAAVIIIAFDLYWFLKLIYLTIFLVISYGRLSIEKNTNWMERVGKVDNVDSFIAELSSRAASSSFKEKLSLLFARKTLEKIKRQGAVLPPSESVHHLVIIPIATETQDIVEPGIQSIKDSTFPSMRILIVLAVEERASEEVKKGVYAIRDAYKKDFLDLIVNVHKDGLPGEARVKGANATSAAKVAAAYLSSNGISFENVVVSCFDSDTVVHREYFACLTYSFITCAERTRASFQPIPVYYNNIWDVPGFARVLETGSSFFQLIEATNPEKMVTFSSHSMSFKALVEAGYWPVDMISDDSAIFWKSYMRFDGAYKVVPMYTTVSMDIVAAKTWWETIVNEYKQKRRWAWGVENFPILMRGFLKNKKISFYNKARLAFKLFEGHIAWATWAFLLTIIGWLPAIFAGRAFQHTVLYYNAPRIAGTIFNLAGFSLLISIVLSICLLPKQKVKHPFLQRIGFAFQWLLVPVIYLFLSAIPALDAQTRLMLGKRMEFWVAEKGHKRV